MRLVANHPHHHGYRGAGAVFDIEVPASRVLGLPNAHEEPSYPRVLIAAASLSYLRGDFEGATPLRRQALKADSPQSATQGRPRVELDAWNLTAMVSLAAGDYAEAVDAYNRGAELAVTDGRLGIAAISLAVGVNTALFGGARSRRRYLPPRRLSRWPTV